MKPEPLPVPERTRPKRLGLLFLLLPLLGPAAGKAQGPPASRPAGKWLKENWVMAVVNDKVITWRDVRSRIPLTAQEIWNNPDRLRKEEDRILRELTSSLLLEEGVYTLSHTPAQVDQFVDSLVKEEMKTQVEAAGGMGPYLDNLKKMGITYKEREEELRENLRRELFLKEKVYQAFQGKKALLQVRPSEMLELYRSPAWKEKRVQPAWCAAEILQIPKEAEKEVPRLVKALKAAGSEPFRGKLPKDVILSRMLVLDCPSLQVGWAAAGLPLEGWEKELPPWSREDLAPPVAAFLFSKGPVPRVSPVEKTETGFRLVRVLRCRPRKVLPFTDPKVQEELMQKILNWKISMAKFQLLQSLWRKARIWPPKLKEEGPPGVPAPWR